MHFDVKMLLGLCERLLAGWGFGLGRGVYHQHRSPPSISLPCVCPDMYVCARHRCFNFLGFVIIWTDCHTTCPVPCFFVLPPHPFLTGYCTHPPTPLWLHLVCERFLGLSFLCLPAVQHAIPSLTTSLTCSVTSRTPSPWNPTRQEGAAERNLVKPSSNMILPCTPLIYPSHTHLVCLHVHLRHVISNMFHL